VLLAVLCAGPVALLSRQSHLLASLTGSGAGDRRARGAAAAAGARWWPGWASWEHLDGAAAPAPQLAYASVSLHGSGAAHPAAAATAAAAPGLLSHVAAAFAAATAAGAPGARRRLAPPHAAADDSASAAPADKSSGGSGGPAGGLPVVMVSVVAEDRVSPYKGASWGEVVRHMATRLQFSDPRFQLEVVGEKELAEVSGPRQSGGGGWSMAAVGLGDRLPLLPALWRRAPRSAATPRSAQHRPPPHLARPRAGPRRRQDPARRAALSARLASGRVAFFTGVGVTQPDVVAALEAATAQLPTALFWDCAPPLAAAHRADGYAPGAAGPLAQLAARVGWTREGRAARVLGTLRELWARHTSDDLLYTWLVVINEYVTVGGWAAGGWARGGWAMGGCAMARSACGRRERPPEQSGHAGLAPRRRSTRRSRRAGAPCRGCAEGFGA
jgi:hypothetical protein